MKWIRSRRDFLRTMSLAALPATLFQGDKTLTPFELTLQRDNDLPTTLSINDCVVGKLYLGAGSLSDPGQYLCDTLELPFRNELEDISCIKPGRYSATVRTGLTSDNVDLGWRLELEGTKQLAIEIHTGNKLANTHGCILVGKRGAKPCELRGGTSVLARNKIRSLYGDDNSRQASLVVLN